MNPFHAFPHPVQSPPRPFRGAADAVITGFSAPGEEGGQEVEEVLGVRHLVRVEVRVTGEEVGEEVEEVLAVTSVSSFQSAAHPPPPCASVASS